MNPTFEEGDILGIHIHLLAEKPNWMGTTNKPPLDQIEDCDVVVEQQACEESYIHVYKNGQLLPEQFEPGKVYPGTYFAGVSLYMGARCEVTLGPEEAFKHRPNSNKWQAVSQLNEQPRVFCPCKPK